MQAEPVSGFLNECRKSAEGCYLDAAGVHGTFAGLKQALIYGKVQ